VRTSNPTREGIRKSTASLVRKVGLKRPVQGTNNCYVKTMRTCLMNTNAHPVSSACPASPHRGPYTNFVCPCWTCRVWAVFFCYAIAQWGTCAASHLTHPRGRCQTSCQTSRGVCVCGVSIGFYSAVVGRYRVGAPSAPSVDLHVRGRDDQNHVVPRSTRRVAAHPVCSLCRRPSHSDDG
jgi:hypothetical protein